MPIPFSLDVNTGQPVGCLICGEAPPKPHDGCGHPLHRADLDPARPYFPDVEIPLTGDDGNAFLVLSRAAKALRRGGATNDEVEAFRAEARSQQSYGDLLATVERWAEVS